MWHITIELCIHAKRHSKGREKGFCVKKIPIFIVLRLRIVLNWIQKVASVHFTHKKKIHEYIGWTVEGDNE